MVHTFTALGVHIAVDVNSGAVHVLDELTCRLLDQIVPPMAAHCPQEIQTALSQYAPNELEEAWQELYQLVQEGLLFVEDDYIDHEKAASVQQQALVKALCLHVSHDCNLRCKYCFASTGDFGTGRKIMDFETAKRAIDFVVEKSGPRRNIEVDFFGGEPLMAMDTVKQTVAYARSLEEEHGKHFRFTITTNGMLLDEETIDYINREMSNVVLSLDGRKQVNDRVRLTPSGKGSYEIIVPKFQALVERRGNKEYYLRGTFTRFQKDFSKDVMHMAQLGFRNISVEPVVGKPEDLYAIQEEDLPELEAEYERLAEWLRDRKEINFFHFNVDLAQGPCVIKRLRGCGAGCEYVAITPEGDIYPCHQFVGNLEYRLGNLRDGSFDLERSHLFAGLNIYTREACRSCWARFYCSGGCSASNLLVNGEIKNPHTIGCVLERKRLECAIALKAIDAGLAEV